MDFYRSLSKIMHVTCAYHKQGSLPTSSCIFKFVRGKGSGVGVGIGNLSVQNHHFFNSPVKGIDRWHSGIQSTCSQTLTTTCPSVCDLTKIQTLKKNAYLKKYINCSKDIHMNDCPVILVQWSQTDGWTESDAYPQVCLKKMNTFYCYWKTI